MCSYSNDRTKIDMVAMKSLLASLPLPITSSLAFLEQARKIRPKLSLKDLDPNMVYEGPQEHLGVHNFHLEAIRRRCDHDCDCVLSFSEFQEVVKGRQASSSNNMKSETFYSLQLSEPERKQKPVMFNKNSGKDLVSKFDNEL